MIYKAAALLLSISAPATSAVGVAFSSMFHGNMAVLQRGVDVNVYGTGNNIQSQSLSLLLSLSSSLVEFQSFIHVMCLMHRLDMLLN